MGDEEITRRLDLIISILKLAHSESLLATRELLLSDPVTAAILDATREDFVPSGKLKEVVAKATAGEGKPKTVQRRVADLLALGALEAKPGARPTYRSTGIV